jgi:hypothetical protein
MNVPVKIDITFMPAKDVWSATREIMTDYINKVLDKPFLWVMDKVMGVKHEVQ